MEVIYLQRLCVNVIQTFPLLHEDFISEWLRWSSRERDVTSWHHVMITWRLVEMTSCVVERCYRELARSLVPTRARPWVVWGSERCRSCNSTGGISQPWSRLRLGCFLWISMASLILREQYFGSLARIRTSSKLMLWLWCAPGLRILCQISNVHRNVCRVSSEFPQYIPLHSYCRECYILCHICLFC